MKYRTHAHMDADIILQNKQDVFPLWAEISAAITMISDEMLIAKFEGGKRNAKSISESINKLIHDALTNAGWKPESEIFANFAYGSGRGNKGTWRCDFSKGAVAVEVAFNHRSDILWNLMKPTLAAEDNNIEKAMHTDYGIIITATENMKRQGGFDSAIGSYEDYVAYLEPFASKLTTPLLIIGLEAPDTFYVSVNNDGGKNVGKIVRKDTGNTCE